MPTIFDLLAAPEPAVVQPEEEPTMCEPEQLTAVPPAFEMTDPSVEMGREVGQLVLLCEIGESRMPLTVVIADDSISAELIQQELVPDEPMHEEDTNRGVAWEAPTCDDESMPSADLPLYEEEEPKGQMQSVEQVFLEKVILVEEVVVTEAPFEG